MSPLGTRRLVDPTRDAIHAMLFGPARFIAPVLGAVILYPLVIDRSGIAVLGLLSLLATVTTYLGSADLGFSQLLAREVGPGVSAESMRNGRRDFVAATRFYALLGVLLAILVPLAVALLTATRSIPYDRVSLALAAAAVSTSAVLSLQARLAMSVLSANADNVFVQLVLAVAPIATYGGAIVGAWNRTPLEGFAAGALVASIFTNATCRHRVQASYPDWASDGTLPWRATTHRIAGMVRRGRGLYSASLGVLLREPLFRWIIALTVGLEGAGIYDVAQRLTSTIREVVAAGASSLYANFARLHRSDERRELVWLSQFACVTLLAFGALLLNGVIAFPDTILDAWLGRSPDQLVDAVRLLALWNLITLANVPFWYLLQASGLERHASASVWAHAVAVLLLVPIAAAVELGLTDLLILWILAALLTQGLIYWSVHVQLDLLLPVVTRPAVAAVICTTTVVAVVTLAAGSGGSATLAIVVLAAGGAALAFPVARLATEFRAHLGRS